MIALTANTSAAIALHAANSAWVIFVQALSPAGQGPIKIEGVKGVDLSSRLSNIVRNNAFEVQLVGMIPTTIPAEYAEAIAAEHDTTRLHDDWFEPTGDLIAFILHAAQEPIQQLLELTHPGGLEDNRVVSIEGIADILGVSIPTVRRMVKAGDIPFLKWGRVYRFVPADVIASLQRTS